MLVCRCGVLCQLPGFSAGFQSLVTSMLSPEARDRPTAEQVARQAEALLLGESGQLQALLLTRE